MATKGKYLNKLSPKEQKTTAAFKLLSQENKTLKKSLKTTQDELESYKGKYYTADKNHALEVNKNSTIALHEVLKFIVSAVCGGLGVYLLTEKDYFHGIEILALGVVLYSIIVWFDRK